MGEQTQATLEEQQSNHLRQDAGTVLAGSSLDPLVKELRTLAEDWRNTQSDPHNISNAVMVALLEVSNAIVKAYGKPPSKP